MKKLYQIGDIIVWKGRPPKENPYLKPYGLIGQKRRDALKSLKDGKLDFEEYSVWYAPWGGGAHELKDNKAIDWERSGV